MTGDPLVDRVLDIVGQIAGPSRIPPGAGPATPLWEGGFWLDSVELFEVVLACEEAFGPIFPREREVGREALTTVGSLAAAIRAGGAC